MVSEAKVPISGAAVTVESVFEKVDYNNGWGGGGANGPAMTDEQGQFNMAVFPKKGYATVKIVKEGYGIGLFQGIMTGEGDVEFVLQSTGGVRGRVTWRDGGQASGVVVEAIGYRPTYGENSLEEDYRTLSTDAEGGFELAGLSPDLLYSVSAHERVDDYWSTRDNWGFYARLRQLLYNEETASCKKNIEISGGQMASVNLVIGHSARVYGHVVSEQHGTPEAGFMVRVTDETEHEEYGRMMTKADGAFSITLDICEPRALQIEHWYDSVQQLTIGPGEEKQVELTVPGSMTIPVRVVDRNGRPQRDVIAYVRTSDSEVSPDMLREKVGEDGRFVFTGVHFDPREPQFDVLALKGDGIIGVSPKFDMEPGKTYAEITVVCAPHGGISGVVHDFDGTPVEIQGLPGLGCAAPLPDGSLCEPVYTKTGKSGEFSIDQALPAGTYPEVYIWYLASAVMDPATPEDAEPETVVRMTTWDYRLGILKNVRINAGKVTPVGEVPFESVSRDELKAMGLINSSL